jgi:hypothetical protein
MWDRPLSDIEVNPNLRAKGRSRIIPSTTFFTMDNPRAVECSPAVGLALSPANLPKTFLGPLCSSLVLRPEIGVSQG